MARLIPKKKKLRKRSMGNQWMLGKSHSDETRKKIGKAQKGNQYWVGKTHTNEAKMKMSESHKGQIPANKGVPMSDEQKKKLSESHKGKNSFLNMPDGKCIHCEAKMKMSHLNRYHNENCKFKK